MTETSKSTRERTAWLSALGPLIGLALVYLFFALAGPDSFTSVRTLETIARQTAIVGTAALGMTLVIILGGIDLSVGSIVAMTSVIVALVLAGGSGPFVAILAATAAGALTGFASGNLITRLKVAPFIVTLGMLLIIRGAAKGLGQRAEGGRADDVAGGATVVAAGGSTVDDRATRACGFWPGSRSSPRSS